MRLPLPVVSSDLFTVIRDSNEMISEASTIGDSVMSSRVYDDACDTGFKIRSERTGEVITVTFREVDFSGDEEHSAEWIYAPTAESIKRNPRLTGWIVRILND